MMPRRRPGIWRHHNQVSIIGINHGCHRGNTMINRLFQLGLIAIGVLNTVLGALLVSHFLGSLIAQSVDQ